MKKFTITSMVLFLLVLGVQAQSVGLKTNFAHWATMATPNLGIEMALNRKYTIEVGAGYNPFTFNNNKKYKTKNKPKNTYFFKKIFSTSYNTY